MILWKKCEFRVQKGRKQKTNRKDGEKIEPYLLIQRKTAD